MGGIWSKTKNQRLQQKKKLGGNHLIWKNGAMLRTAADGDLRGRRDEADPSRPAAVLHQAGGDGEEPQVE